MAGVKILRMSRCSITTFSKSLLEQKVPNITNLDISHNPLTCNCELSWIPDHVRDGRLTLENEIDTLCARPRHLVKKPLLTATLCPNVRTHPTVTAPELTVSTPSSEGKTVTFYNLTNANMLTKPPTERFSKWSTNPLGM